MKKVNFKALSPSHEGDGFTTITMTGVRMGKTGRWRGDAYELIYSDNQTRGQVMDDCTDNRRLLRQIRKIEVKMEELQTLESNLHRQISWRTGYDAHDDVVRNAKEKT